MLPVRRLARILPLEAVVWTAALVALAFTDPDAPARLRLCLLDHLGVPCPGCGLGRSIAATLHGDLTAAFALHPLGPVAFLVLAARVVTLARETHLRFHRSRLLSR